MVTLEDIRLAMYVYVRCYTLVNRINIPRTGETIEVGLGHFAVFALDAPLPHDDLLPVLLGSLPAMLRIRDVYPGSRISDSGSKNSNERQG